MTVHKEKAKAKKIFDLLSGIYPAVRPALEYSSPFELLISTILSAQCTDERVNRVTLKLFKKYRTPEDYLNGSARELEKEIFSTGYYRQKAKNIRNCCSELIGKFGGEVPSDFELLLQLPGVGRKTASVVAGNAFGIPAIAVDTHVKRLSNLLGFIDSSDPVKIEFRLKELLPEDYWINASHWLASHGRIICKSRNPLCHKCVLAKICPSFNPDSNNKKGKK
jgi:endonuclease III